MTNSHIYDYNLETKDRILLKQQDVMGGEFDSNNYGIRGWKKNIKQEKRKIDD